MPKIFISYRRDDSQWPTDRLHQVLKQHVADPRQDIFIDVDNIPLGVNFAQHLDQKVAQCDVLLAIIGPNWLTTRSPETGERRLDDPKDFVRIEVASALKRGIPVVPVLLDDVPVPAARDLPEDLKDLSQRNGIQVRRLTFDADVDRLVRGLNLSTRKSGQARSRPARSGTAKPRSNAGLVVTGLVVVTLAGGGAAAWFANPYGWRDSVLPGSGTQTAAATSDPIAAVQPTDTSIPPQPPSQSTAPAAGLTDAGGEVASPATPDAANAAPASATGTPAPQPANTPVLNIKGERTLQGHAGAVYGVAFSPDGARIASCGEDKSLRLWDARTGQSVGVFSDGLTTVAGSVDYTRDGSRVLVTAGRMIQIRDANTGAILKSFDGVSSPTYVSKSIYEGAFSPDGARIVTGFVAGAALWDTATGSLVADLSSGGNVSGVGFSPDGTRVATEADDNTMRIWDTRSGQETHRFTGRSYGAAVAFSPDGSRIAGKAPGFYDIRVWNTSTGKPVVTLKGHSTVIAAVRYSPDGSRLVSVDYDGWIRIWNAATGQELGKTRFADPNEGRAQLYDVDYSPDGSRIATASVDGSVRIWKIEPN